MNTNVTLTPTQTYKLNPTVQVDDNNVPLVVSDPTYGDPVYDSSDATVAVIGNVLGVGLSIVPTGKVGNCIITGTETSSDTTKSVLTGTVTVAVVGPAAASLDITGTVEGT